VEIMELSKEGKRAFVERTAEVTLPKGISSWSSFLLGVGRVCTEGERQGRQLCS